MLSAAPETPVKQAVPKDREKDNKRLARCGRCVNCKSQDCGSCYNCADKPKFGGPGIKKQACIARKCLLMVPRDEDGEKLARKRAKQRTFPPPLHRLNSGGAPTPDELSLLAAATNSPVSPSLTRSPSFASLPSPRSEASSPQMTGVGTPEVGPVSIGAEAARAQQLSEQALFSLALDDDDARGSALTSAMLFAAIRTPHTSPLRPAARVPDKASDKAADKAGGDATGPLSPSSKRRVELDLDEPDTKPREAAPAAAAKSPSAAEKAHAEALSAAFTAHIAAKLELDEPPRPPRLDELHEEFLLLNAEHRRADESDARVPILAF